MEKRVKTARQMVEETGIGVVAVGPDEPVMAVLQATVAPAMQGRVFTLMVSMATAISPLGLAVAGPVADRLGVQIWYVIGGALCMGMGALAFFIPSIANMEDHRAAPEVGDSEVTLTSV